MEWIKVIGLFVVFGGATTNDDLYDYSTCGKPFKPPIRLCRGCEKYATEMISWSMRIEYQLEGKPNETYRCSGTLISKKHVLTAAHCFPSLGKGETPFLSSYNIIAEGMCHNGCHNLLIGVKNVSLHEKFWVHGNSTNDVALIELDRIMPNEVHHACLPTRNFKIDERNDDIIITELGWRQYMKDIRQLKNVVLGKRSTFPNLGGEFFVYGRNGLAACEGDSGMGATSEINGRYVLVGVQTKGSCPKGEERSSNYFTDVVQWLPQIEDAMRIKLY